MLDSIFNEKKSIRTHSCLYQRQRLSIPKTDDLEASNQSGKLLSYISCSIYFLHMKTWYSWKLRSCGLLKV